MYHGIIQESNWTRKGSYLRKKIEQYGFDKVINHGRIWRLVHDSKKPDYTKPRMQSETPAQLVAHLSHPNGWWRDTAQRTLVLRQDASVVPALTELAQNGTQPRRPLPRDVDARRPRQARRRRSSASC